MPIEAKGFSLMFPYYQIACAIVILMCIFPLPAHWRAGNTATILLGFWNLGGSLICLINTLVWRGNLRNPHPVWGDLTVIYYSNMGIALSGCLLAIVYRLWRVARTQAVLTTKSDKKRQNYLTWFLCLGVPLIQAGLHFITQGHRYNVLEDLGPFPTAYQTWVTFVSFYIWEPLVTLISAIFCGLTIRIFLKQRKDFDAIFGSQSGHINKDRYVRLMLLGAVGIGVHFPLSMTTLIVNGASFPIYPWKSWDDTHSNWLRIAYINRFIIDASPYTKHLNELSFSLVPVSGFCYFFFFGFGEEATRNYKAIIGAMLKPFGIKYPKEKRRRAIKKTWLDVLLCRPGQPVNLTSSAHSSTMPEFATNNSSRGSRGNTRSHSQSGGGTNSRPSNRSTGKGDFGIDIDNLDFLDANEARKQAKISAYTRPGQAVRKTAGANTARNARRDSLGSSIHSSIHGANETDEEEEKAGNSSDSGTTSSVNEKAKIELPQEMDITEHQRHDGQAQPEELNEKAAPITTEPKGKHITIAEGAKAERDLEAQTDDGVEDEDEDEDVEYNQYGLPVAPPEIEEARATFRQKHPDWTEPVTF